MSLLMKSFDAVTSLVDFYGFRDKRDSTVDDLTVMIRRDVKRRTGAKEDRIMPYVQMHEFEGLLFSDVGTFRILPGVDSRVVEELRNILSGFRNPEEINDNKDTAPSKRISGVFRAYNKVVHGAAVAE